EELRRRLTAELGVEWGPDRNGCREIVGFDGGWLRTFSKRTVAIEEHLAGAGPEDPDPATRMRARDAASLATRPARDRSYTPEMLRERWQAEADGIGMPLGHALEAQVCGRTAPELQPTLASDELVDSLIDPERAVRALCSAGPALCSLISPAGFGKTTTIHAAVVAAGQAGLPVVGLAATNQAAGELRHAGIPAMTIARFTLDGARLTPRTV